MAPKRKHASILSSSSKSKSTTQSSKQQKPDPKETSLEKMEQAMDEYFSLHSLKMACEQHEKNGEKLKAEIASRTDQKHVPDDDCDVMIRDLKDLIADYDDEPKSLFEPLQHKLATTADVVISILNRTMSEQVVELLCQLHDIKRAGHSRVINTKNVDVLTKVMQPIWETDDQNRLFPERPLYQRRHLIQLYIWEWQMQHNYRMEKGVLAALVNLIADKLL